MSSKARTTAEWNFVRQQGFRDVSLEASPDLFRALMWQPRVIGGLVLVGLVLQAWPYFLGLAALLWWNAVWPRRNPFDALYWHLQAKPRGRPRPGPAPSPRRFAQAVGGTFMLAIAFSLLAGSWTVAWVLEAILVAELGGVIFGRFCQGSYLFLLLTGQGELANRTLPWSHGEQALSVDAKPVHGRG